MSAFVEFLAGAVTSTYVIAGVFFLRFWRRTHDRLFLSFAGAFWLLAVNQIVVDRVDVADERSGLAYLLRVVGFLLILYAIVEKNLRAGRSRRG
jgi:ABC-type xylose transport system permease subunit